MLHECVTLAVPPEHNIPIYYTFILSRYVKAEQLRIKLYCRLLNARCTYYYVLPRLLASNIRTYRFVGFIHFFVFLNFAENAHEHLIDLDNITSCPNMFVVRLREGNFSSKQIIKVNQNYLLR